MWHQYRSHRSVFRLCECLEVKSQSSTPGPDGLVNHIFSVVPHVLISKEGVVMVPTSQSCLRVHEIYIKYQSLSFK